MPLNFVTVNNAFQLLGDSLRLPTGAPPLDPASRLPSPDPLTCAVLKFPSTWFLQSWKVMEF